MVARKNLHSAKHRHQLGKVTLVEVKIIFLLSLKGSKHPDLGGEINKKVPSLLIFQNDKSI